MRSALRGNTRRPAGSTCNMAMTIRATSISRLAATRSSRPAATARQTLPSRSSSPRAVRSRHGVEITATSLARPANEPPFGSWFVDFDGTSRIRNEGHVGDVEIWHPCEGRAGPTRRSRRFSAAERSRPDDHHARRACRLQRRTVCATGIIDDHQFGHRTFNGPLTVVDTYPTGAPTSSTFAPSPPWNCAGRAGPVPLRHSGIVLVPGASAPICVRTIDFRRHPATASPAAPGSPRSRRERSHQQRACADPRVRHENPGQPSLSITKTCAAAVAGAAISCRITVVNLAPPRRAARCALTTPRPSLALPRPSRSGPSRQTAPNGTAARFRPTRCRAGSRAPR